MKKNQTAYYKTQVRPQLHHYTKKKKLKITFSQQQKKKIHDSFCLVEERNKEEIAWVPHPVHSTSMLLMADGGKPKIRHKNMADGVAKNGGRYGGQENNKNINKKLKKKQWIAFK